MKKILCALSLAIPLFVTPVLASEVTDFFSNENTTLRIVRYYDSNEGKKARVKGTLDEENHIIGFKVEGGLEDAGWSYDDESQQATALKVGNVDLGREDFVRLKGIYGDPVAYTPLDDTEELQGDLTPGVTVDVKAVQNFLRPDHTTYSVIGDTLFRLHLDQREEAIGGEFKTLVRAWETVKFHGLRSKKVTRHLIQNYSQNKVTFTTTKLAADEDNVLETSTAEFIALTKTGTYESNSNEAGLGVGVLPEGYKIIG